MSILRRLGVTRVTSGVVVSIAVLVGTLQLGWSTSAQAPPTTPETLQSVIIRAPKPYGRLVRTIQGMGGRVTHQFRLVNAIAAQVPERRLAAIRKLVGANAITKDVMHPPPAVASNKLGMRLQHGVEARSSRRLEPGTLARLASNPDGYLVNSFFLMNMIPLFVAGFDGDDIKVALIDSGIRPGFPHLESDGSVIGGENLTLDGVGYLDDANEGHGTYVAGMVSANAVYFFDPASPFAQAVTTHCPACAFEDNGDIAVPMIGSAPSADIYALKVFPVGGSGAPESTILAAMERALLLKQGYLNGDPQIQNPDGSYQALDIGVVNMSIGGLTYFAGRDLEDQLTREFRNLDIVLTKSGGNAGPSGTTGGSPGTGIGGLTVGAAAVAFNERIVIDLILGPGFGELFRASTHTQTAVFSSRGPTTDGRPDPDLVSNGDWNYGQGFGSPSSVDFAGGTSFSAASVAGVAAVVRQAVPSATAHEVEAALVQGANPNIIQDGSGPLDQGGGYVDGTEAALLLFEGGVDLEEDLGPANHKVRQNIRDFVQVTSAKKVTRSAPGLKPGQRYELYYEVKKNVESVTVTLHDVVPGALQNELFGDDILLAIHSAKTHLGGTGDYLLNVLSLGGTWVFQDPEPGLMRITLVGDWTNASPIDAKFTVQSGKEKQPKQTAQGKIAEGQELVVPVTVPAGVSELSVILRWKEDWGRYPTADVDVYPTDPNGTVFFDGATLDSPERLIIEDPVPGAWQFFVVGFAIYDPQAHWELTVIADGVPLKKDR